MINRGRNDSLRSSEDSSRGLGVSVNIVLSFSFHQTFLPTILFPELSPKSAPINMRVHPIFCLVSIVRLASGLQYCHEDVSVPVHFCVAIAERYNVTSGSKDLVVTLGHRRFSENGWVGLGIGGGMAGALLLVGYMVGEGRALPVNPSKRSY
jgi:hypothetical protein